MSAKAAARRTDDERAIAAAWNGAALARMKKMPSLDRLLNRSKEPRVARKARHWTKQLGAWKRALSPKARELSSTPHGTQ